MESWTPLLGLHVSRWVLCDFGYQTYVAIKLLQIQMGNIGRTER